MKLSERIMGLISVGVTQETTAIDAKHIRFTNVAALLGVLMILPWAPFNFYIGELDLAIQSFAAGALMLCILPLNHVGLYLLSAILLMAVGHLQVGWSVWMFGGLSGIPIYYIFMIVFPYFTFHRQNRSYAHGFAVVAVVSMIVVTIYREQIPPRAAPLSHDLQVVINTAIAVVIIWLMAAAIRALIDNTEQALQSERERADALLLNVLPPSIAGRLKHSPERAIADRHDEISVLFADIVGFTPLSAQLSPGRTVELLNQVFTAFDEICDRIGVEKVRTIGDGYMAVAGAPEPRTDHAEAITRAAIEMRDYMASGILEKPLQVRIGINTGEAVGGIVGTSRFHYDLWGDAVNVAARMESLGVPGRIQIAQPTWQRIRHSFACESRGVIDVKGKDRMQTWFVA